MQHQQDENTLQQLLQTNKALHHATTELYQQYVSPVIASNFSHPPHKKKRKTRTTIPLIAAPPNTTPTQPTLQPRQLIQGLVLTPIDGKYYLRTLPTTPTSICPTLPQLSVNPPNNPAPGKLVDIINMNDLIAQANSFLATLVNMKETELLQTGTYCPWYVAIISFSSSPFPHISIATQRISNYPCLYSVVQHLAVGDAGVRENDLQLLNIYLRIFINFAAVFC